jgi:penicillin-binding protein 1A
MARAFAVFGNEGRDVKPIAIRAVEDRNGRVVLDVERDLRLQQRREGSAAQVISAQNAYIMTKILEKTVEEGTLAYGAGWGSKFTYKDANGKSFKMPVAGKTGTPQNWSDAWAVGYSPYYTTAIWFGFDKPGNSLGVELTGSTLAGPVWGDYMRDIHQGLPRRDFARPATGIFDVTVCAKSGLLKTPACNEGDVTLPFLEGTQPSQYCNIHGNASGYRSPVSSMPADLMGIDVDVLLGSLSMPILPLDLLPELRDEPVVNQGSRNRRTTTPANRNTNTGNQGQPPLSWSFNNTNPLLDDSAPMAPPAAPPVSEEAEIKIEPEVSADDPPDPVTHNEPDNGLELPSWNPLLD